MGDAQHARFKTIRYTPMKRLMKYMKNTKANEINQIRIKASFIFGGGDFGLNC